MQLHCKKCGKDVTMETEFETRSPYRIINNHKCDVKAQELRDEIAQEFKLINALERGFVL
jgi:hypothetical protein